MGPTLTKRQMTYKQQLRSAHKPTMVKTKVSQIIKSKLESCSQMRHSTVWQGTSFCISQIPVIHCGGGCAPRSMVTKPVPYTCLPSSRSLETWRRLSQAKCIFQLLVLTLDFKHQFYK